MLLKGISSCERYNSLVQGSPLDLYRLSFVLWVSQEQPKALEGLTALVRPSRGEHYRRPTKEHHSVRYPVHALADKRLRDLMRPLRPLSQAVCALRPLRPLSSS